MEEPYFYRNKVHATFKHKKNGDIISGIYEEGTHKIVPVDSCLIENEKADAIKLADQLKGNLLLVHGLADDNVHAQQSWLYIDALVKAGKQFEMQFYPDDNHFLRNGSNYEHLHNRLLLFLQNNL